MFSRVLIYRGLVVYKSLLLLLLFNRRDNTYGECMYVTSPACNFHAPSFDPALSFLYIKNKYRSKESHN